MPIFISHSNPLNCHSIYLYICAINDPIEHWTSWKYLKSHVRLSDSCDSTSADGILYLITTVCFINWNGCWRLTLFITSESLYEIANNISSSLRYINFKIIVL